MQRFLKNADERRDEAENVRIWVAEIKDLAFRIENVIEDFAIQVASKRETQGGFRRFVEMIYTMICKCIPLHRVGSEIEIIQNDFTKLKQRLETFNLIHSTIGASSSTASQREILLRKIYPHVIEHDFVGMANDEKQLVSHLVSMGQHDRVITIKGMGGQGKTTMASRLYNHREVRDKFSNFAWVCVTQICQTKTIWQNILKQLCPESKWEVLDMDDMELPAALYKIQQEKKCLVVLDDIWSTEDWNSLRPGFPVRGTIVGSKLLLTTRELDAEVGHVHELNGLNDDEAWLLLQKKAFPGNEDNLAGQFTLFINLSLLNSRE